MYIPRVWRVISWPNERRKKRKGGRRIAIRVVPDEPAALKELEDRLMDRLLLKVREESGSEGSVEPK